MGTLAGDVMRGDVYSEEPDVVQSRFCGSSLDALAFLGVLLGQIPAGVLPAMNARSLML